MLHLIDGLIKLSKGQLEVVHQDKMMCLKWKDKHDIYVLTTVHSCAMVNTGRKDRKTGADIQKPAAVLEYNKYTGGVDQNDQMYSFSRKVMKVWKIEFFFFLKLMVL